MYKELKQELEDKKILEEEIKSLEELDKRREVIQEELDIINKHLDTIDKRLSEMKDKEKKVFRCRYIWGLSVRETAERLHFSQDYVKEISSKINKK